MFQALEFLNWGSFVMSTTYVLRIELLKLRLVGKILVRQLYLSPRYVFPHQEMTNKTLFIYRFSVLWTLFSCINEIQQNIREGFFLVFLGCFFLLFGLLWEDSLSVLGAYFQLCIAWAINNSAMPTNLSEGFSWTYWS